MWPPKNPVFFKNRAASAAISFLAAAFLLLCLKLFARLPGNADTANALLVAQDMAAGNWRLAGWWIAPDNYWGLDETMTALCWAATHNSAATLHLAASLNWLILGGTVMLLGLQNAGRARLPKLACLAALFLIPVTASFNTNEYFSLPFHVLTTACMLASLALADALIKAGPPRYWVYAALAVVVTDAAASDPMFLYLGAMPLLAGLLLAGGPHRQRQAVVALLTALACLAGRLLVALNQALGGFTAWQLGNRIASDASLPTRLHNLAATAASVLGATTIWRWPLLLVAALPVCQVALTALRHIRPRGTVAAANLVDLVLGLIVLTDLALMLLQGVGPDNIDARFFLPGWAAGSALAARHYRPFWIGTLYVTLVALLALGADLAIIRRAPPAPLFGAEAASLLPLLQAQGVPEGYANYWLASPLTVLSGSALKVTPLIASSTSSNWVERGIFGGDTAPHLRALPYPWFAKSSWYRAGTDQAFFVVIDPADRLLREPDVLASFGPPDQVLAAGAMTVLIYHHPSPALLPPPRP